MEKPLLSLAESKALRGIAILGIMLHNYCHFLGFAVKENEYTFTQAKPLQLLARLTDMSDYLFVHVLSFFGHYGVPVFLFISGFGLVAKYERKTPQRVRVLPFVGYHYMKLLRLMLLGYVAFAVVSYLHPHGYHGYTLGRVVAQLLMYINLLPDPDHIIKPGPYWFFGLMLQLYVVYRLLIYRQKTSNVLALIAWRLVCALGESFAYTSTNVTVNLCDTDFTARGRVVKNDGWKAAERAMRTQLKAKSDKKSDEDDDAALPAVNVGDTRVCTGAESEERATKPLAHHSEESILDFMEHAGRAVEDDELASVLKAKGIGTPATRASIIEGVVKSGYAKRERKQLLPTEKAYAFVRAVSPALREPATTAEWEQQLAEIESGTRSLDDFMSGIEDFVRDTVKGTHIDDTLAAKLSAKAEQKVVGTCPVCGQGVVEKAKSYSCSSNRYERDEDGTWTRTGGCGFSMPKTIAGKKISATSAAQLLKRGRTSTLKGFKSKAGKTFEAALRLDEDGKVAFEFEKKARR